MLKKQLEEERRQIYEEERWILQKWMGAEEELEQVKVSAVSVQLDVQYYRLLSLVAHHMTSWMKVTSSFMIFVRNFK